MIVASPFPKTATGAYTAMHWGDVRPVLYNDTMESPVRDRQPDFARLIVAVGRKDRDAFAVLFQHFAPRIKTMMMRSGLSGPRAEDLAQDTMLAVWHKAPLFDPAGAGPSAWIYTISRNLRIDRLRRERRAQTVEAEAVPGSDAEQALPDSHLATLQAEEHLRLGLAKLSEEQKTVVTLSFFESKPHSEIALALGIPLGTVKSRLRLAIKRLRTLLEEPQ
jgi:RNA polymerase sigma-70 factor (ECF subfamily)